VSFIGSGVLFIGEHRFSGVDLYEVRYQWGNRPLKHLPVFDYRCEIAANLGWGSAGEARSQQLSFAILFTVAVKSLERADTPALAQVLQPIVAPFEERTVRKLPEKWALHSLTILHFLKTTYPTELTFLLDQPQFKPIHLRRKRKSHGHQVSD